MTLFDPAAVAAAPEGPSLRVRLTVAYDGTDFRGFAVQKTVPTVGGVLTEALSKVLGHPVELTCAGRTDAGVHAWGQVVSFDCYDEDVDLELVQRSINKMLGPPIVIRDAAVAAHDFNARHSARGRRYRYTVLNTPVQDPFTAKTAWHVDAPLDLRAMQLACDPLIGEHDFRSFCRQPSGHEPGPLVRRVRAATWVDLEDGRMRFDIEANAFCQQMVRALVGVLVEVGIGKRRAGEVTGILRAGNRSAAGQLAPPHGLCLWEVLY
ncbi:MAG TPA: tRNA pseudouridine(38-40) synthase TruA [Acidimicrobiales bacterium]|nr:tRNA pseudouridine(38-40) synthase TruA [Acidimicrobiales bacterium]